MLIFRRVNIGNARPVSTPQSRISILTVDRRLYGMEDDLGLVGNQFQTAVSLLFVTYLLSEVPSNLVLKKFRPSRWIAFIAVAWGIIATLTGVVQSYAGLIVCRLLLGLVEGGLFPGMTIYLTMFYTKKEIALRIGMQWACLPQRLSLQLLKDISSSVLPFPVLVEVCLPTALATWTASPA